MEEQNSTKARSTGIPQQGAPEAEGEAVNGSEQRPRHIFASLATTFGLSASPVIPEGWSLTGKGVWEVRETKSGGAHMERVTTAPVIVTRVLEDPDGQQRIELAWLDRGRVVRRIVPKEIARRGRKLVEALGSAGLPASDSTASLLEKWLLAYEDANSMATEEQPTPAIPRVRLARYLGWQRDGSFLSSPEDCEFEPTYEEQGGAAKAHRTAGTFDGWRRGMQSAAGTPVPRACVAASLAATLLKPLRMTSFGVDISGRSTSGKTTAAMAGVSAWADPSEEGEALGSWRTTFMAAEKRFNLVRGLPVVLDESQCLGEQTRLVDDVLYQLPKDHGKGRGGGYPSMIPWSTIMISTGERSALTFTRNQGASARVLCATDKPFPDADTANAVRGSVRDHFGHAGPAFIREVCARLAIDGAEGLRREHAELAEQLRGETDISARRAPMVAVLALAERLACGWGILPYEPMPTSTWADLFTTFSASDNRPEMALDIVRTYVVTHFHEIWTGSHATWTETEQRPPVRGWLGTVTTPRGSKPCVALDPERVRQILKEAGYELDAVVGPWVESGHVFTSTQRPAWHCTVKLDGKPAKLIKFTPDAIPLDAGEDAPE